MPRLTNNVYLNQREFLKDAWTYFRSIYAFLSYDDQMIIHAFYRIDEDLTDEEAIAHRKQVTMDHPSLPHRAGKLYARMMQHAKDVQKRMESRPQQPVMVKTARTHAKARGQIRVKALARPQPDLRRVAKALLGVARDMQAGDGLNNEVDVA